VSIPRSHGVRSAVVASVAIVAVVVSLSFISASPATGTTASAPVLHTTAAIQFRNEMRTLWEQHVWWTRMVIVEFAHGLPDLEPTVQRLLRNQVDIGNAIRPYYGNRAADRLTALLKRHIELAAKILAAAKNGNTAAFDRAKKAWYVNARRIAKFLHSANPDNWPLKALRTMMKMHLDLTLQEASDYLTGRYPASIQDFGRVEAEVLRMADTLSIGIIKQFPSKFS
jgi:hypothetical protein